MRSAVIQLQLSNYNPGGAAVCSCSVNLENAHNHKKISSEEEKVCVLIIQQNTMALKLTGWLSVLFMSMGDCGTITSLHSPNNHPQPCLTLPHVACCDCFCGLFLCNTRTAVQKYEKNTAFDWLTDSNQGIGIASGMQQQ